MMTKQTPHLTPTTLKEGWSATEGCIGTASRKTNWRAKTSLTCAKYYLNSEASPNYIYRIRPNYHTNPYKRAVKKFHSLQISASVLFLYFFIKACCGYSFELHRLVDAIQMSTHNICLYKENHKKNRKLIIKQVIFWPFYSVSLVGRYIFYHKWVFPVLLKTLSACCGYTFELHRLVDAIQMSAHNICLYIKKIRKKIAKSSSNKSFSDLFIVYP